MEVTGQRQGPVTLSSVSIGWPLEPLYPVVRPTIEPWPSSQLNNHCTDSATPAATPVFTFMDSKQGEA